MVEPSFHACYACARVPEPVRRGVRTAVIINRTVVVSRCVHVVSAWVDCCLPDDGCTRRYNCKYNPILLASRVPWHLACLACGRAPECETNSSAFSAATHPCVACASPRRKPWVELACWWSPHALFPALLAPCAQSTTSAHLHQPHHHKRPTLNISDSSSEACPTSEDMHACVPTTPTSHAAESVKNLTTRPKLLPQ